jgi:hypothetical protein
MILPLQDTLSRGAMPEIKIDLFLYALFYQERLHCAIDKYTTDIVQGVLAHEYIIQAWQHSRPPHEAPLKFIEVELRKRCEALRSLTV